MFPPSKLEEINRFDIRRPYNCIDSIEMAHNTASLQNHRLFCVFKHNLVKNEGNTMVARKDPDESAFTEPKSAILKVVKPLVSIVIPTMYRPEALQTALNSAPWRC